MNDSLDNYTTLALVQALIERIEHSNGLHFVPEETRILVARALLNYIDTDTEE
jgi:hypothetical protein